MRDEEVQSQAEYEAGPQKVDEKIDNDPKDFVMVGSRGNNAAEGNDIAGPTDDGMGFDDAFEKF